MIKLIALFFTLNIWVISAETIDFGGSQRTISVIEAGKKSENSIKNINNSISSSLGAQEYVKRYPNGKLELRGTLLNGKKVGIWYFYNEEGTLVEEHSMIGLTSNFAIKIFSEENKRLVAEGLVVDGAEHGEWKLYDENEKLLNIVNYDKGVRDGIFKSYSPTGKLILIGLFKDNELVDAKTVNQ